MSYRLSSGVRARKEGFGLLFYDSRDARLTFVRSGTLLSIDPAVAGGRLSAAAGGDGTDQAKVHRILARLLEKGLIVDD